MKSFESILESHLTKVMAKLIAESWSVLGLWDETKGQLSVRRPNSQVYYPDTTPITQGGYKVFGVETVGNEVHVLTGPIGNPWPSRRVKYNSSGVFTGMSEL